MRKPTESIEPRELADWLLARGHHWVTVREAAELLSVPAEQVAPVLARYRRRGLLFAPTRGAYVPVPPEYRSWGAVPASHFIDPMMRFLGHEYYVGLLSAAEVLGVAHQRPQLFQVVCSGRLRDRAFGRVRLEFHTSARVGERATRVVNTPTGTMRVSTPEVTVFDIVAAPLSAGGLSNVMTVIGEMLELNLIDERRLVDAAPAWSLAVAQRVGWLTESAAQVVGAELDLTRLASRAGQRSTPSPLSPLGERRGRLDSRWNVLVNATVEPDL